MGRQPQRHCKRHTKWSGTEHEWVLMNVKRWRMCVSVVNVPFKCIKHLCKLNVHKKLVKMHLMTRVGSHSGLFPTLTDKSTGNIMQQGQRTGRDADVYTLSKLNNTLVSLKQMTKQIYLTHMGAIISLISWFLTTNTRTTQMTVFL